MEAKKDSRLAECIRYCARSLLGVVAITRIYLQLAANQAIPIYLCFTGGAIAAFGVRMYYVLIPEMDVGPMMSSALTGQLIIAFMASHFGWFGIPVKQIELFNLAGIVALIAGGKHY